MKTIQINAISIPDLWFQSVYHILDYGRRFKIDSGSYAGQERIEFDYFTGHIRLPGTRPLLPEMPENSGLPAIADMNYVETEYLSYLMTAGKKPNETYTYGERLAWQIQVVIDRYKKYGYRNNQLCLQVAMPSDLRLTDPPCLRHIDTRIQDGKIHFFPYFRSWDLWNGLPVNLAGLQLMKEYMASEIGVDDGEMIVSSKGLHIYGYAEQLAKIRCNK